MIIDFKTDPKHAQGFDILDRKTGTNLNHLCIFYADDDKGFYRSHKRDEKGLVVRDRITGELAWEEFAADIVIRPKPRREG